MAFIQCDFFSQVLGFSTSMNVILPDNPKVIASKEDIPSKKPKYPTLYLLHGLSDDHTAWMRRTAIEHYVKDLNIAVVMPNAGRSFYTDMKYGYNYYTFISEELISIAESFFPLSSNREDRFIAGLSMGGYGALKIALSHPENFSAAASLSGAVDIGKIVERLTNENALQNIYEFNNIFGDLTNFTNTNNDLFKLSSLCSNLDKKPRIYLSCGTEDFLYEDNLNFKTHMENLSFDFTYEEEPGSHEWEYWDKKIQSVIKWLFPFDFKPV